MGGTLEEWASAFGFVLVLILLVLMVVMMALHLGLLIHCLTDSGNVARTVEIGPYVTAWRC